MHMETAKRKFLYISRHVTRTGYAHIACFLCLFPCFSRFSVIRKSRRIYHSMTSFNFYCLHGSVSDRSVFNRLLVINKQYTSKQKHALHHLYLKLSGQGIGMASPGGDSHVF